MALSRQDRAFYEEKLGWKTFGYLFVATTAIGAIGWPLLFYMQDVSSGQAARWNFSIVFDWALIGFMLGSLVAVFSYFAFKFFLSMGWLPSRR